MHLGLESVQRPGDADRSDNPAAHEDRSGHAGQARGGFLTLERDPGISNLGEMSHQFTGVRDGPRPHGAQAVIDNGSDDRITGLREQHLAYGGAVHRKPLTDT